MKSLRYSDNTVLYSSRNISATTTWDLVKYRRWVWTLAAVNNAATQGDQTMNVFSRQRHENKTLRCSNTQCLGHRRRSSVNFGEKDLCPKIYAWKINKMPKFYIFARKINKMPEFYMTFARKIFFLNFGEGSKCPPCPPSPTPMVLEWSD